MGIQFEKAPTGSFFDVLIKTPWQPFLYLASRLVRIIKIMMLTILILQNGYILSWVLKQVIQLSFYGR